MTRVPLWDTARFAIIVLVVVGHAIQRLTAESDAAFAVYTFIYGFHMPALILVSGYFARALPPDESRMKRVFTDLVVPYVIFQVIWTLIQWIAEGQTSWSLFNPKWTLWFLVTLAIFRLVLPYLALLRWPLLWAVLGAVLVGYWGSVDTTLSLSRTVGLLPFFVIGWMLASSTLVDRWLAAAVRTVVLVRLAATALLGGWLVTLLGNADLLRALDVERWLFYSDSFRENELDEWWAGAVRLGVLALGLVLSLAFLVLVPRRETPVTALGQATMYVYLLHTFVLYPLREGGFLASLGDSNLALALVVVAAIALTFLLSTPLVQRIFRPLVQPRAEWLFRRPRESEAAGSNARAG